MPVSADTLRRLAALKLAPEAMGEVLSIIADMQAAEDGRRTRQRERKARSRAGHVTVTGQERDGHGPGSPDGPSLPQTPSHPLNPPPVSLRETSPAREPSADFVEFWRNFPNKVGKPAAIKAFPKALKAAGSVDVILAGLRRYVDDKPADRPWLNPATFLNQQRWTDRPAPPPQPRGHDPPLFTNPMNRIAAEFMGFGNDGSIEGDDAGGPGAWPAGTDRGGSGPGGAGGPELLDLRPSGQG